VHAFVHSPKGLTKDERVHYAFSHIAVSVFNGGMTTLVALLALIGATSYIFKSFFICFMLIICFGLYFGMVFLPVPLLSIIAPIPTASIIASITFIMPLQQSPITAVLILIPTFIPTFTFTGCLEPDRT
jgi:hypothetical protein